MLALEQQSAVLALAGRFAESGAAKKAALAEADAQAQPRKLPAEDPCRLCARRCPRRAFLRRRLRDDFLAAPFSGEFLYPAKDFLPLLNLRLAHPRFARPPAVCCATGVFGGNDTAGLLRWCEASLLAAAHPANRPDWVQANGYQASVLLGEAALGECIPCGLAPLLPQGMDSQEDYRATGFMHLRDLKRDRAALLQSEMYLLRDFHDAYFETARRFDALALNAPAPIGEARRTHS